MPIDRYDAYADLGGRIPELTDRQKRSMAAANLGSEAMKAEVARAAAREKEAQDARELQENVARYREEVRHQDAAKGIDINSQEYRLKELKEARARSRRS